MARADDDSEIIPFLDLEQSEDETIETEAPEALPILPLRNTVLFPGVVIPITVGRDKSIRLIKEANASSKIIGVVAQKDTNVEDPTFDDLNRVGTLARILRVLRMPDGNTTVIIQGKKRISLTEPVTEEPYIRSGFTLVRERRPAAKDKEFAALVDSLKDMAIEMVEMSPNLPSEAAIALRNIEDPAFLVSFISSNLNVEVPEKQRLLEIENLKKRAIEVLTLLTHEYQLLHLKQQIQSRVKTDIDKQQREYFLTQQLRTIQEELGGATPDLEVQSLRERGRKKKWPQAVADVFNKELDKMARTNPAAADYSVVMNYVELMLDLPWNHLSRDRFDLKRAQRILDQDHFGLEKIKERIIEYLAVLKLKANMKAPILCLVGPPGVGKTSLGKSIAKAIGREYVRISLGGVRDEAAIRGHRRTYIGALPGRIIQSLKKAGTSNPVLVMDEIDKVGMDARGDVSSALLEVLDPEQNKTFYDHYLEVDYDLSKVMFICTANSLQGVHPALIDRMEIIELSGYTLEEKVQIAKKYLVPKQREEHGLLAKHFTLSNKVLEQLVSSYTLESGVRTLDNRIAAVVRNVAKHVALEEVYDPRISPDALRTILGAPRYESDRYDLENAAGVVTGLAWTSVGGDILYIESSLHRGNGRMLVTGNVGKVMSESATLAMNYLKAHTLELGIAPMLFSRLNVHLHVPAGATPKDGPSAGITMLTSLASAFTQRRVRPNLAMTGEITLRGKVLPVGGIKEKILAAKRAGITHIILCEQNRKDIDEIKSDYLTDLTFEYVRTMAEVLDRALMDETVAAPIDLQALAAPDVPPPTPDARAGLSVPVTPATTPTLPPHSPPPAQA